MKEVQLAIIGGGPAGLAAAVAARRAGVEDILILERDRDLGGILSWPYEIEGDFEGHF